MFIRKIAFVINWRRKLVNVITLKEEDVLEGTHATSLTKVCNSVEMVTGVAIMQEEDVDMPMK